jgi:hypothetical protein
MVEYNRLLQLARSYRANIFDFDRLFKLHNVLFSRQLVASNPLEGSLYTEIFELFIKDTEKVLTKVSKSI